MTDENKECLLPLAMKVVAKTIGYDLVPERPMGVTNDGDFAEFDEDNNLISEINDGDSPIAKLLYMDFLGANQAANRTLNEDASTQ